MRDRVRRACVALCTSIVIVALLSGVVACGGGDTEDDDAGISTGQLPVVTKGARWVYTMTEEGVNREMSMEVIEEEDVDGEGYYVVEMAFDPPMDDFLSTVFAKVSKALYLPERMDANATYMGEEVSMSTMGTYDFHGSARWPLAVGNEYTVTENLTTIITAMGTTESENESQTNTYKVEALEDITVPAGTFECFRVVEYDETGGKMVATWYSDQVRNTVREEDHETGGTQDLVSYSLK